MGSVMYEVLPMDNGKWKVLQLYANYKQLIAVCATQQGAEDAAVDHAELFFLGFRCQIRTTTLLD